MTLEETRRQYKMSGMWDKTNEYFYQIIKKWKLEGEYS